MGAFLSAIWEALAKTVVRVLGPTQVCWLCIGATASLGMFAMARFADAADVRQVITRLDGMEADEIAGQLYDFQTAWCVAPDKRWLRARIDEKQRRYAQIEGKQYTLPDCAQL